MPHDGSGTPVPFGTRVEVQSLPPYGIMSHGPTRAIGYSGVDFVESWHWGISNRLELSYLPIDLYRVWSPQNTAGTAMVRVSVEPRATPAPEDADAHSLCITNGHGELR